MNLPVTQQHRGTIYDALFRVSWNALKRLRPRRLNISETIPMQDERFGLANEHGLLILALSIRALSEGD
ncbi:MAG TPA: hypothetical protein VH881_12315 [Burkholderiales bacterium]|jgi:hypothetical protein